MRPICVKCNRAMTREECGVLVAELYLGNKAIYKLWYADLFRCTICRTEIVYDFAEKPFWNEWEKGRDGQKDAAIKAARDAGNIYEVLGGG